MSEGLLYKKIREMCPPAEEVFLNEKGQEIFTQEQVEKVLNLAKQDFPKPYEIPNKDWNLNMEKLFKWFKKWFGNAEEKEG